MGVQEQLSMNIKLGVFVFDVMCNRAWENAENCLYRVPEK